MDTQGINETITETKEVTCKICKLKKKWIQCGVFGNRRDKRWKNEDGLICNGKICGMCNRIRARKYMDALRLKKEKVENE